MNTIKKKLLTLLVLSMSGSMLLAGLILTLIIKGNYEESTRLEFNNYYDRARSTFKQIQLDTKLYSGEIAKRPSVKNALNLISEYADIENYQANIYDEEKKNIARTLLNYGKSSHLQEIRVYDKKGWLVAFSRPNAITMGIISFIKGKPLILVSEGSDENWKVINDASLIPLVKIGKYEEAETNGYISDNRTVGNENVSNVVRTYSDGKTNNIGKIYVINTIGQSVLNGLSKGSQGTHGILLPNNKWNGDKIEDIGFEQLKFTPLLFNAEKKNNLEWFDNDDYLIGAFAIPLLNGENFYLVSSLNRNVINKHVNEIIYIIIVAFLISIVMLLPMVVFFSRYTITSPIDKLVQTVKSLEKGDYKSFHLDNNTSYEINELAVAFNNTANKVIQRENELRTAHDGLEERVEERTTELVVSNDKLKKEIDERVIAEIKAQESSQMVMSVIESIPQYVFWKDINSIYLGCNKNFSTIAGLDKADDIIGKTDYDLPWTKSESDSYIKSDARVIKSDIAEFNIQKTQQTAADVDIDIETNKVPLHDIDGNVVGVLGTYQDITSRKNFEKEIINAKDIAEQANNAKSDFLSHMSHELRTPLNAILGFAQLLELDLPSDSLEENISNVKEILEAGRHLLSLINEVLDLAKIESSELILNIEGVDALDILNDSLKLTSVLSKSNNINVEIKMNKCNQQLVLADATRLKQIFINFVTNAIKYNKDGGEVIIECENIDDAHIKFNIIDTGIGISEGNIKKIFTPFERLGIEKEAIDGTGIGLVICKKLIELMDGTFGVESTLDEGSAFWFTLPSTVAHEE